jgi:hypothetical protein
MPPVESPQAAVNAAIVAETKKRKSMNDVLKKLAASTLTAVAIMLAGAAKGQSGNYNGLEWEQIGNAVEIYGYNGSGGAITIPATISNLPVVSIQGGPYAYRNTLTNISIPDSVTSIGNFAFQYCSSLISVSIGSGVTNIGEGPFTYCISLTAITMDAQNAFYSSVDDVLFDKSQATLVEYAGGLIGSYTIPDSVTSVADYAFAGCFSLTGVTIPTSVTNLGDNSFQFCPYLTNVTIPDSVTSIGEDSFSDNSRLRSVIIGSGVTTIGEYAFAYCNGLSSFYFKGNAPAADSSVFVSDNNPTAYYLPGNTGWSGFSANTGLPVLLWTLPNPLILNTGPSFGVQSNLLGFIISWATNVSVVVEACTNLTNPVWQPLQTNTLTNGLYYFTDPQWMNYHARYYRISSP